MLRDGDFQYECKLCKHGLLFFQPEECSARGVRKVTTGIVACDSQVFSAMLPFDPSTSALPTITTPKSQCVGLFANVSWD